MADTSTGLPVQTLTGQFIAAKITDAGGTNQAAVSAAGRVSVDASGVAVPVTDNAASLTVDAPVGTPVFVRLSDGSATLIGQKAMAASLPVVLASDQSAIAVTGGGGVEYVGDAAATTTPTGKMAMALAKAAAPSDTSADNDAVAIWALRNGSQVVNLASGGTLITLGQKVMASSIPVTIASDQTGFGITQYVGDAAATATPTGSMGMGLANAAAPTDVSANNDAVAMWMLRNGSPVVNIAAGGTLLTNIGQAAATATFVRINDGTTTAGVIVGTTALKVDIASVVGAVPGATNPIPVRLTDGAAFYAASSGAPTDPKFSTKTSAALGTGASITLTHYVTSGKTGQLIGVDVGSTVPLKVVINTEVTGTPTGRVVLFTKPYETYQWRAPFDTYITRASADASSGFSVTITNKDAAVAADVYSTAYWDEV